MTEPNRWVVIDDRDSRISYSGNWITTSGDNYSNQGNRGQVYQNTLRGSTTDGSSFSFSFTGNAARITGTNDLVLRDGVADIDWDCILDGRTVTREDYFPYTENNWVFCLFSNLVPGSHTIGARIKNATRNFWFDQIRYRPTEIVENEFVAAIRDDGDLQWSDGWAPLAEVAHNTLVTGSTATFRFIGTGVSLWAMYPNELPHNPGDATYTLDDGPAVSFTIPGGGDVSQYNRRIFRVPGLSQGNHTIRLQYTSSGGSTPLVVGEFLIEGGTNLRVSTGTTNGGSPTSSSVSSAPGRTAGGEPNSSPSGDGGTPVGTIVGAVIGALALTAILGLVWYYFARRRRLRMQEDINSAQFRIPPDGLPMVAIGAATPPPHQPHPAAQTKRSLVSSGLSFPGHLRQTSTNSPISTVPPTMSTAQAVYHENSLRSRAAGEDVEERPPMYSEI